LGLPVFAGFCRFFGDFFNGLGCSGLGGSLFGFFGFVGGFRRALSRWAGCGHNSIHPFTLNDSHPANHIAMKEK